MKFQVFSWFLNIRTLSCLFQVSRLCFIWYKKCIKPTYLPTPLYIHTFIFFNFDVHAQETHVSGDRIHYLPIDVTPPAVSSPARSFHATQTVPKHRSNGLAEAAPDNWQPVRNEKGLISIDICVCVSVCVNFELRPGSNEIYICWFLILMLWHIETHTTHKGTEWLPWTERGYNSLPPDWVNIPLKGICQKWSDIQGARG